MVETEADLLARCREGDEAAWGRLYARFAPITARFLGRILGKHEDLDDVVQQVFFEVFTSIRSFRGESSLSTWIYGVSSRVASKHVRTAFRWRRRVQAFSALKGWQPESGHGDAVDRAHARSVLRVLNNVLEDLDLDHRLVWVMREVEGLPTEEVAAALNVPEGTIRSRLYYTRKRVFEALGEAGAEPEATVIPLMPGRGLGTARRA